MTIYKTKNLIETYRVKSKCKNINELSGRTGRPDLTHFVVSQIILNLPMLNKDDVIVDVGCGDGCLLVDLAKNGFSKVFGILPTVEEIHRVKGHLIKNYFQVKDVISISLGLSENTELPPNFSNYVICNSVLHNLGKTLKNVELSINEFYRISKKGGIIFIGEIPDMDELKGRNYGDSIFGWLFWVLRNRGIFEFLSRIKQTYLAIVTDEPLILTPKEMFYMAPDKFITLLESHGFKILKWYKHLEIDKDGNIYCNPTRWNYIAMKI